MVGGCNSTDGNTGGIVRLFFSLLGVGGGPGSIPRHRGGAESDFSVSHPNEKMAHAGNNNAGRPAYYAGPAGIDLAP